MIHHQHLSPTRHQFNFLTGLFVYLKLMSPVYLCLTLLILLICGLEILHSQIFFCRIKLWTKMSPQNLT